MKREIKKSHIYELMLCVDTKLKFLKLQVEQLLSSSSKKQLKK